jgi:hypothetical protein
MSTTIHATFDGQVLRPEEPIALAPNTRVRITIEPDVEPEPPKPKTGGSFLKVARTLKLEGPPDWSERLDDYLYGGFVDDES